MEHPGADWPALVGKLVILNSFGIVRIQGVAGDQLLVGDPGATTAIPLAIVRTVESLEPGTASMGRMRQAGA